MVTYGTSLRVDADTSLIRYLIVGKRDAYHAKAFMADLADRVSKRSQVSSDSLKAYADAVERGFGSEADYGTISKTYSLSVVNNAPANVRNSPAEVVSIEKTVVSSMPDVNRISTGHVEKQNRMLCMPPVDSAQKTVQFQIVKDVKSKTVRPMP